MNICGTKNNICGTNIIFVTVILFLVQLLIMSIWRTKNIISATNNSNTNNSSPTYIISSPSNIP